MAWRFFAALGMTAALGTTIGAATVTPPVLFADFNSAACDTLTLGTLSGDVKRLDGSPAIGAQVAIFWNDVSVVRGVPRVVQQTMRLTTTVGADGVYRACNIPLATDLLVVASASDSSRGAAVQSVIDNGTARFLDLIIGDGSKHLVRGRIVGINHQPLGGARVGLVGSARTWLTDTTGHFLIPDAPSGSRMLEVQALGYEPQRAQVDVGRGIEPTEIAMSREAVMLDSVKTVASGKTPDVPLHLPFEERRQNGIGYFITAAQIADMHVLTTDEILRRVPSVRVMLVHTRSGDQMMLTSTRGRVSLETKDNEQPVCILDVFIDGRRSNASDIRLMEPNTIHGIEVHSVATMPAAYHTSQCGAVFVWTK